MTIRVIRKSDKHVFIYNDVAEVSKNIYGSHRVIFEDGTIQIFQANIFDIVTEV